MSNTNKSTKKALLLQAAGRLSLIIVGGLLLIASAYAETDGWNTEVIDDGTITVRSRISKRADENGDEVQLLEYVATTTASVSMESCIAVIKDVSKHKEFLDDEVSKKVETLSDNEWVVYYYTNSPWPIPDVDNVTIMNFSEDEANRTATFELTAAPSMYEEKGVKRMVYYKMTYAFKDLGSDKVEMTLAGEMVPAVQAPDWMVRAIFPEGPGDTLRRIIELANNI